MKLTKFYCNLSIRKKLITSFGTIFSLVFFSALLVMLLFFSMDKSIQLSNSRSEKAVLVRELQLHTANVWQFVTDASLVRDRESLFEAEKEKNLSLSLVEQIFGLPNDEQENDLLIKLRSSIPDLYSQGRTMFEEYGKSKVLGDKSMEIFDAKGEEIIRLLNPLVNHVIELNLAAQIEADNQFNLAVAACIIGVIFILTLMFFVAKNMVWYINNSFNKISNLSNKITIGDFSNRITNISNDDEFGKVMWELNEMVDAVEALLKEVGTSLEYSSKGKFFRKPLPIGLKGMLYNSAEQASSAIAQMEKFTKNTIEEKEYLVKSVDKMLEEMMRFANGDLTIELSSDRNDEIGKLFEGFNSSVKNIRELIGQVAQNVSSTAETSVKISSSSEQMAADAQEQSARTSEIASAVEEMTKTILETTRHSSQAAEAAKHGGEIAFEGGKVVDETIAGMDRIAEVVSKSAATVKTLGKSSEQIGEIIQVIDDIADQTNLLALNAAIEAARAGEQGRGFAVVADEVRKLAERTTKATKEIAAMIKQIQTDTNDAVNSIDIGNKEVQKGKRLADKAGESLKEIINSTREINDMIMQVAAASEQQSTTAEEVSKNIEAINNVIQESALGVQQIASASIDLNEMTENLQKLISKFKITGFEQKGERNEYKVRQNGKLVRA